MLKRWIGYVSGCKTLMDVITQGRMGNKALEWQKLAGRKLKLAARPCNLG
jgi:uncharacterized protein (DUF2235 family)